jgi:PAS domain S-box-containing protein
MTINIAIRTVLFSLGLFAIYFTSFYSYLLFHSIAETFSILIAGGIFFFAWNSRDFLKNHYFLFIGVAYLFVGTIDLAHMFSYKGMGVFTGYDSNLPTQLWIAARYMESASLIVAFLFFKRKLNSSFLIITFILITAFVFSSIFYWRIFPDCFVEGEGLTVFKIASEYIISLLFLVVISLFFKYRSQFDKNVFRLLVSSAVLTICAELAFTFYVSVFGLSNLLGHFCKLISFYLIYLAVVKTGLKKPYDLLFRDLRQSEEELQKTNQNLITEITERQEIQKNIQESENKYRQMFEDNTAIKLLIDPGDGLIINANQAALRFYGYEWELLSQMTIMDINMLPPEKVAEEMQNAKLEKRKYFTFQHRIASGQIRDVEVYSGPIIDQEKTVLFSIVHDVTERKQAEKEIEYLKTFYQHILERVEDGIWVSDSEDVLIYFNPGMEKISGIMADEALGMNVTKDFAKDTIQQFNSFYFKAKDTLQPQQYEAEVVTPVDRLTIQSGWLVPRVKDGNYDGMICTIQDVTENRRAEAQIQASLKEKDTLLHEIHHRVKNNMQVINSLLKLQANTIEDNQVKDILKESQGRVFAMSAVHETLHGSENISEIDLKSYLLKIASSIFQTYLVKPGNVKLTTDVENLPVSINQAYPLGLIINEIISNSLKYAFPDDCEGEIILSMKQLEKEVELIIKDNGIGISKDLNWKNSGSLGLKLVRTLVEDQLDGSIEMESLSGTKFTIKFNIET